MIELYVSTVLWRRNEQKKPPTDGNLWNCLHLCFFACVLWYFRIVDEFIHKSRNKKHRKRAITVSAATTIMSIQHFEHKVQETLHCNHYVSERRKTRRQILARYRFLSEAEALNWLTHTRDSTKQWAHANSVHCLNFADNNRINLPKALKYTIKKQSKWWNRSSVAVRSGPNSNTDRILSAAVDNRNSFAAQVF